MTKEEKIYYLEKECFKDPWSLASVSAQLMSEQTVCVIYEEDGEPAAYALGNEICGEAELFRIAVVEKYRRRGLGARMMEEFLRECTERKAEKVFLEVRSKNRPAMALYEKYGFTRISVRKGYYGDDDAVIFMKSM